MLTMIPSSGDGPVEIILLDCLCLCKNVLSGDFLVVLHSMLLPFQPWQQLVESVIIAWRFNGRSWYLSTYRLRQSPSSMLLMCFLASSILIIHWCVLLVQWRDGFGNTACWNMNIVWQQLCPFCVPVIELSTFVTARRNAPIASAVLATAITSVRLSVGPKFVVFWTISKIKDEKSAAKFHYITTVSGTVVAQSIAFRVVSIYWQGAAPFSWYVKRKGTDPHWKHLHCTHFASYRGSRDVIASLACVRLTGWPVAWNWRCAVLSVDAGLLVSTLNLLRIFVLCNCVIKLS